MRAASRWTSGQFHYLPATEAIIAPCGILRTWILHISRTPDSARSLLACHLLCVSPTLYVCHPPCVLDKWQQPLVHMKSVTTCWVDQEARPVDRPVLALKFWGKALERFWFS